MRSCSQTIFLGFQTERSPFAINGDGTCFKNFNNNRPILFFVCYLVEKVEIILLFESEKLNCTNNFYRHDFPKYANFEG